MATGHLQSAPELLHSWNWHPAQTLSLIHHRDIATAVELALAGALDGDVVNIVDEAPTSVYEIASIVGASYGPSAAPLSNPWMGQLDGSLARSLGFRATVPTVYQAQREGIL
jgi:UDP-glucose 4-epimerase